jgi:hypothetical protein
LALAAALSARMPEAPEMLLMVTGCLSAPLNS